MNGVRSLWKSAAWHVGVLLANAALGVWHTWPLAAQMTGVLFGAPRDDPYMNTWHLWWMRKAFTEGHNPFFTPMLHHPLGAELYWHTLCPAKTSLGVVLLPFMSAEAAYNLLLLSTFVTTGWAAWLLLRYLLQRSGVEATTAALAAFAGACVFNFSRYHLTHAVAHLNLSSLEGLPLYVYFFLRWLEQRRWKDLAGVGAAALYTLLCDYYYLLYAALLSVAFVLYLRWKRGPVLSLETLRDEQMKRAAFAAGAAFIACLPMLVPLALHAFPQPLSLWHGDSDYHADLLGFFLPDRGSLWVQSLPRTLRDIVFRLDGNVEEDGYFLGAVTLVIAAFGIWRGALYARFWLWSGVAFAVLSLGTRLTVAGSPNVHPALVLALLAGAALVSRRARSSPWGRDVTWLFIASGLLAALSPLTAYDKPAFFEVPLPYLLFKHLVPFFNRGGMPVRLELITTLGLAVLFAFGVVHLATWSARKAPGKAAVTSAVACVALAAVPNVEYLNGPVTMERILPAPPIFEEIRREPLEVAVFTDEHRLTQFEQITYQHPMTYARLSRMPVREHGMVTSKLYQVLMHRRRIQEPVTAEESTQMREYLKAHRLKYYVSHLQHPMLDQYVEKYLHGQVVHRDAARVVYRFADVN